MIASEEFFERIKEHRAKGLPFVVYSSNAEKKGLLHVFLQNSPEVFITENYSETGFVFAPFDPRKKAILFPKENSEILETVFNNARDLDNPTFSEKTISGTNADKKQHIDLVERGVAAITRGQLKKVVLSRKEIVQSEYLDIIVLLQRLLKKYPDAFVYLMHHPKIGTWLGATPEVLLHIERNRIKTMALAGTKKYTGENEVAWGEKEKE